MMKFVVCFLLSVVAVQAEEGVKISEKLANSSYQYGGEKGNVESALSQTLGGYLKADFAFVHPSKDHLEWKDRNIAEEVDLYQKSYEEAVKSLSCVVE